MRKFILVAAMVLASATAQAGEIRSLTLASSDQPAVAEQPRTERKTVGQNTVETPKAVEAPAATDAPKFVERPAAIDTKAETPKAETAKPVVVEKNTQTTRVEKPKRRRESTEARVIYELHRHGIYW